MSRRYWVFLACFSVCLWPGISGCGRKARQVPVARAPSTQPAAPSSGGSEPTPAAPVPDATAKPVAAEEPEKTTEDKTPDVQTNFRVGQILSGLASWYGYGDDYHGQTTASGKSFDREKLTAAHYDLPLGTQVRVTNKRNGKAVIVQITDRFPLATLQKGRIIDLSYRAARVLGMIQSGIVPVTVEIKRLP